MILAATLATPAAAIDTSSSHNAPNLVAPRARIKAKDFAAAIAELKAIADKDTHADVFSLLGFALRKTGNIDEAKVYYAKALDLDPDHLGTHEYLGELYLQINDIPKAREHLVILEGLCPQGCEELEDLRQHIVEATTTPASPAKVN